MGLGSALLRLGGVWIQSVGGVKRLIALYYGKIEESDWPRLGFQASLMKLLPEVLQIILIGVLSEAGSSENFGLP